MGQPEKVTRETVAAAYRLINNEYKPWHYCDFETWKTLPAERVADWLMASIEATRLDWQWRKESKSITCVWGNKGEPEWWLKRCEGLHAGETLDTRLTRTTGAAPGTPQSGKPAAKPAIVEPTQGGLM